MVSLLISYNYTMISPISYFYCNLSYCILKNHFLSFSNEIYRDLYLFTDPNISVTLY